MNWVVCGGAREGARACTVCNRYIFLCVLLTVRATLEGCTPTGWYVVPQRWLHVLHPLAGNPVRILCFYYARAHFLIP